MMPVSRLAPAKVNLALHVTGRRADGYHLLQSIVVFTDFGDQLTLAAGDGPFLSIYGPYGAGLSTGDNNLVVRAANLLAAKTGNELHGLTIRLEKNLPVEAGIGGGSADAAAALHLLNNHWGKPLNDDELANIGLSLGADVPVCLLGRSAYMSGIGEQLAPIAHVDIGGIVLVNPGVGVPTGTVFAALAGKYGSGLSAIPDRIGIKWLSDQRNDLERPAMTIALDIADILTTLNQIADCRLARMSGSGATVFGLFDDWADAQAAAQAIGAAHPNWWVQAGGLL